MSKPQQDAKNPVLQAPSEQMFSQPRSPLKTPTNSQSLDGMLCQAEAHLAIADNDTKVCLRKIANAAHKAFADRALAWGQNEHLTTQNNEKKAREAIKSIVVGNAKVMSYEDIVEARKKRDHQRCGQSWPRT